MFKRVATGFFLLSAFLLAQACSSIGGSSGPEKEAGATGHYTPVQGLSASQRFREVLELLEDGSPVPARAELILYLDAQPDSAVGQDLLQQIDLPSFDYFPEEYHAVHLESGQSLSTLSKLYLGSVYKFHALAKYNGISEPRSIKVGQEIRIPLTETARLAVSAMSVNADEQVVAVPAAGSVSSADAPGEAGGSPGVAAEALSPLEQADNLHKQALNAFRAQDLDKAIGLWDQVLSIDPGYENAKIYRAQAIELQNKLTELN